MSEKGRFWSRLFARGRTISVLIVDDEDDIRLVVRSLLEDGPFDPIWEAADGSQALDAAYRHQPDLVILDYALPRLDGEAVTKGFRVLAPDTHVLVLTGVLETAPSWGDSYLHKLDIARLPEVVRLLFGRGGH